MNIKKISEIVKLFESIIASINYIWTMPKHFFCSSTWSFKAKTQLKTLNNEIWDEKPRHISKLAPTTWDCMHDKLDAI